MPLIHVREALALDTAILAIWAHRWSRGEVRACRLLDVLRRSRASLVLTLHHVVELLGHESDDVVESRRRFIRNLGQLFWVKSHHGGSIGGILDIHALEIRARVENQNATYPEILSRVRSHAFAFGDSREVSELMEEPVFVKSSRDRIRRRRMVASIARTEVSVPDSTRQQVVPTEREVPLAIVLASFEREQQFFESQLRTVGDRELAEPDQVARKFFDELRKHAIAATVSGCVNFADLLRRIGIQESDLNGPVSADALGDKYVWKRQAGILARIADLPKDVVEALRRSDMPSTYLYDGIVAAQKRSTRAEGGNFDDASLACLSFYAVLTSVDKRTAEAVRQIRSRCAELDRVMGPIVKIQNLEALETVMAGLACFDPQISAAHS